MAEKKISAFKDGTKSLYKTNDKIIDWSLNPYNLYLLTGITKFHDIIDIWIFCMLCKLMPTKCF